MHPADANTADALALSQAFGDLCRAQGWTVATAESCTGGGIAQLITRIAGSSDYLQGGIVAYSNDAKQALLGVSGETLATRGAVSTECATEMARGARSCFGTDIGICSTGIAGPGGATARKPVGLVYVGVATAAGVEIVELHLDGNRQTIMTAATVAALDLAYRIAQREAGLAPSEPASDRDERAAASDPAETT